MLPFLKCFLQNLFLEMPWPFSHKRMTNGADNGERSPFVFLKNAKNFTLCFLKQGRNAPAPRQT